MRELYSIFLDINQITMPKLEKTFWEEKMKKVCLKFYKKVNKYMFVYYLYCFTQML